MEAHKEWVYNTLKEITEHVYYLANRNDNTESSNQLPYIVYQIVSKRPIIADNKVLMYRVEYQITLVTKTSNDTLTEVLEETFNTKEVIPVLISTYQNDDYSINHVYQITLLSKGGY